MCWLIASLLLLLVVDKTVLALPDVLDTTPCFELPVVTISPEKPLPQRSCEQKTHPGPECMKQPVHAKIEVVDIATGGFVNCVNSSSAKYDRATVHYRGQSSLGFSKHQFGVRFSRHERFLDFPQDKDFVLHGPWVDGSLLRNHLAHWMFRSTGRYSPRSHHVVLFIRRDTILEYVGIYLALEAISYGPNRVALAPSDQRCGTPEELSGGWAWQINPLDFGEHAPNLASDKYMMAFAGDKPRLMYPPGEQLTQPMRDFFVSPETGPLPRLYRFLYMNMTNAPEELSNHIEIGSFVDYLLHTELSLNTDAYRKSAFFFKDRGQPTNAGPVWDFNLAYGITDFGVNTWLYAQFPLWARLVCHYKVAALIPKRWRELRGHLWSDERINQFLNESEAPLQRQLNTMCKSLWSSSAVGCANVKSVKTFADEVNALRVSVVSRAKWMDERLVGGHLFRPLTADLCGRVPVSDESPLPQFNCGQDHNDGECLVQPDKYIVAATFPRVRTPYAGPPCQSRHENASVDHCWQTIGGAPGLGLTPFCSGHGTCEAGPGAVCHCTNGYIPPSCARAASLWTRVAVWGWLGSQVAVWLALLLTAGCIGISAARRHPVVYRARTQDEATPVATPHAANYGAAAVGGD